MFVGVEQTGKNVSTKFSIAASSMRAAFATMDLQKAQKKAKAASSASAVSNLNASTHDANEGKTMRPFADSPAPADGATNTNTKAKNKEEEALTGSEAEIKRKMEKIGVHM